MGSADVTIADDVDRPLGISMLQQKKKKKKKELVLLNKHRGWYEKRLKLGIVG